MLFKTNTKGHKHPSIRLLSNSKTQLVNQRKQKVAFSPWTAHSPEIQSYRTWWGAASPILNDTPVVYTSYNRTRIRNAHLLIYIFFKWKWPISAHGIWEYIVQLNVIWEERMNFGSYIFIWSFQNVCLLKKSISTSIQTYRPQTLSLSENDNDVSINVSLVYFPWKRVCKPSSELQQP